MFESEFFLKYLHFWLTNFFYSIFARSKFPFQHCFASQKQSHEKSSPHQQESVQNHVKTRKYSQKKSPRFLSAKKKIENKKNSWREEKTCNCRHSPSLLTQFVLRQLLNARCSSEEGSTFMRTPISYRSTNQNNESLTNLVNVLCLQL